MSCGLTITVKTGVPSLTLSSSVIPCCFHIGQAPILHTDSPIEATIMYIQGMIQLCYMSCLFCISYATLSLTALCWWKSIKSWNFLLVRHYSICSLLVKYVTYQTVFHSSLKGHILRQTIFRESVERINIKDGNSPAPDDETGNAPTHERHPLTTTPTRPKIYTHQHIITHGRSLSNMPRPGPHSTATN